MYEWLINVVLFLLLLLLVVVFFRWFSIESTTYRQWSFSTQLFLFIDAPWFSFPSSIIQQNVVAILFQDLRPSIVFNKYVNLFAIAVSIFRMLILVVQFTNDGLSNYIYIGFLYILNEKKPKFHLDIFNFFTNLRTIDLTHWL